MSTLDDVLAHLGYGSRPQQQALYEALLRVDQDGVIVQAGTGTGKSIAVLCAAADLHRETGEPVAVVTPTKILMDQYITKDVPAVSEATGLKIVSLKGRSNYLCEYSTGMRRPSGTIEQKEAIAFGKKLHEDEIVEGVPSRFGCRGSKTHPKGKEVACHAFRARQRAMGADVIVTNLHMLVIDSQLRAATEGEFALLPDFGAIFVDEAHVIEETVRGFSDVTIANYALDRLVNEEGARLRKLLAAWDASGRGSQAVQVTPELVAALTDIAEVKGQLGLGEEDEDDEPVTLAAQKILWQGQQGMFDSGQAVLHFRPSETKRSSKLISSWVNLGGLCRSILTRYPVGLVSATIPGSMAGAIGLQSAKFLNVGHPFNYREQAVIKFSTLNGAANRAHLAGNFDQRCKELLNEIRNVPGGALLLFSAMKDMRAVYERIGPELQRDGRMLMIQEEGCDKRRMGERFARDGRAVLFGSDSFATGFDVPGEALSLVGIWKLPYPALDPVMKVISGSNFRRYEDMMLVKVAQAIGRLIRTTEDRGVVFIVDSRGRGKLLGSRDPLIAHLSEFRYADVLVAP